MLWCPKRGSLLNLAILGGGVEGPLQGLLHPLRGDEHHAPVEQLVLAMEADLAE
jgi:hypothetical protein